VNLRAGQNVWIREKTKPVAPRPACQRIFDLAIDLQGLMRSGLLSFCTRAPVRIGFRARGARVAERLLQQCAARKDSCPSHVIDRILPFFIL